MPRTAAAHNVQLLLPCHLERVHLDDTERVVRDEHRGVGERALLEDLARVQQTQGRIWLSGVKHAAINAPSAEQWLQRWVPQPILRIGLHEISEDVLPHQPAHVGSSFQAPVHRLS